MFPDISTELRTQVTPQMVIASNLLRLSAQEVGELIERELTENPALEMDETRKLTHPRTADAASVAKGSGDLYSDSHSRKITPTDDLPDPIERIAARESVLDQLVAQVGLLLRGRDYETAVYLLQCLDEHGFLDASCEQYARELAVSCEQIQRVIDVLHELQPPGIAARNARECLLIQSRQLQTEGVNCELVTRILEKAWKEFLDHRWDAVTRKLHVSRRAIQDALQFMHRNLNPYPLQMLVESNPKAETFTRADLIVHRDADKFTLEIPDADLFELRISPVFQHVFEHGSNGNGRVEPSQRAWVNDSLARARMFIIALNQRWMTLRRIGEYLLDYQHPFFERGVRHLKPLTRAELAHELGVHESTISRAIADKTLQLPNRRIIPLADLFDNSLGAKQVIRQLLQEANGTLSDRELAQHLRAEGFTLARRTVTKYRLALGIPNRPLRRRATNWREGKKP